MCEIYIHIIKIIVIIMIRIIIINNNNHNNNNHNNNIDNNNNNNCPDQNSGTNGPQNMIKHVQCISIYCDLPPQYTTIELPQHSGYLAPGSSQPSLREVNPPHGHTHSA